MKNKIYPLSEYKLKDLDFKGVYKVYLYNHMNKPITIQRFIGNDEEGLIYIGTTFKRNLNIRLLNFIKNTSIYHKSPLHTGSKKIVENPILENLIRSNNLMFSFFKCEDTRTQEREEIKDYVMKFGEKPPLNG